MLAAKNPLIFRKTLAQKAAGIEFKSVKILLFQV